MNNLIMALCVVIAFYSFINFLKLNKKISVLKSDIEKENRAKQ